MMRARILLLFFCGLLGLTPARAQSGLDALPTLRSAFDQRREELRAGHVPQPFLGTASVAPNYGFPWMASLQIKGEWSQGGHFCGGVAIAPAWVLTAAHCVISTAGGSAAAVTPENIQVLIRSNILTKGGDLRPVQRIVVHPQFHISNQRVPENDLALIHLAGRADLPVLPIANEAQMAQILKDDEKVRIFGWGTSSFRANSPISTNLLYTFVDLVPRAKCNEAAIYAGAVKESMFCAGLGFADACQGDSGGPAIGYVQGEKYLVGITSWGVGCTNKKYPGVYVNVTRHADWIHKIIGAAG